MLINKGWKPRRRLTLYASAGSLLLALVLLVGFTNVPNWVNKAHNDDPPSIPSGLAALHGYKISLFASSTASYYNPDALVVDRNSVFIDYQNTTAKDCTDTKTSTVVQYTMDGDVVKTFTIPGHSDGMRVDPATHLLWTTSCEDGNPKFATIDPKSGRVTSYTFPTTPHGGGYDDLYFLNGKAFIAASNPTLDKNGVNSAPAVDEITLSNGKVVLTPILMGNAVATNTVSSPSSQVTLNLTDPDSLSTDGKGDLVLVSQADSELVIMSHPGTSQQSVSVIPEGTQLDDTVWTTNDGRLLVSDGKTGKTFWVQYSFKSGTIYTEAPSDSGVAGFVGTVDPATGIITPVIIGLVHPTGMIFVPES